MKTYLFTTNDLKSRENMRNQIDFLNDYHKGKNVDYQVTMKRNRPVRSVSANGYYWIILQAIAAQTGDTKDDLHEVYKLKFNSKKVQGLMIGGSTSDLDTAGFATYVNQVKTHAKDFHKIYVPEPTDRFYSVWEQQSKEKYDAIFLSI